MNVFDLRCGDYTLSIGKRTYIMGILNVTPDSFSDGGKYLDIERAIGHCHEMVRNGADIIDVGGESTRPGHSKVGAQEELKRLIPVVERLVMEVKVPISIDTNKALVAEEALKRGAHIINDIWGLQGDPEMASVVAKYDVPIIIMHNKDNSFYREDIIKEMLDFFYKSINIAISAGIKEEKIIIDPGIGFGKNLAQNLSVMKHLHLFRELGYPILLGVSRKSMIGKVLNVPENDRLEGTAAAVAWGIASGVDIIRVHDVREMARVAAMTEAIMKG